MSGITARITWPTLRVISLLIVTLTLLVGPYQPPAKAQTVQRPIAAAPLHHPLAKPAKAVAERREAPARATRSVSRAASNRAIAAASLSPYQFSCLNKLWENESGWNHRARNPYSGAYGIPQAYPASKMASAGSDWRTNPRTQIRWGLRYIEARYGTPCGAWSFWKRNNWY